VYKLIKVLHEFKENTKGMKYEKIDNYFKKGLVENIVNHNLYCMHKEARKMAILIIYVNNLLLTISNPKKIE
jgi:hypothetical protein